MVRSLKKESGVGMRLHSGVRRTFLKWESVMHWAAHLSTLIWDAADMSSLITHERIQRYWATFSSEGYIAKEHVTRPNLYTTHTKLWTLQWWNACNLASRSNPRWVTINFRLAFRMGFYGLVPWTRPAYPEKGYNKVVTFVSPIKIFLSCPALWLDLKDSSWACASLPKHFIVIWAKLVHPKMKSSHPNAIQDV